MLKMVISSQLLYVLEFKCLLSVLDKMGKNGVQEGLTRPGEVLCRKATRPGGI